MSASPLARLKETVLIGSLASSLTSTDRTGARRSLPGSEHGPMDEAGALREALVDDLVRVGTIRSSSIERAMRAVPRHRFLGRFYVQGPDGWRRAGQGDLRMTYDDVALPTSLRADVPTSSASQPSLVASMLEALDLSPGHRVLEIGLGSGYNAALLAELVGDPGLVTSVDIDPEMVGRARRTLSTTGYGDVVTVASDGWSGALDRAPFDRIVATVGSTDVAPAWLDQLTSGGSLLVPLLHAGWHPLHLLRRDGVGRVVGWSGFLPIEGAAAGQSATSARARRPSTTRHPALSSPLSLDEGRDLGWHLALSDRRAAWLAALDDGQGRAELDATTGDALLSGTGDALLPDLLAAVERWRALGSPRAGDYRSTFVPLGTDVTPDARTWVVDRVAHRQIVRLPD